MESSQTLFPTASKKALQVIQCKAAVCWADGEPLVIEEIEVDPPKKEEVRLKMLCASLCHTDVLFWKGFRFPLFPRVLGHEGVGMVESVGEGVTELKEGDLVIPTYLGECRDCENCFSGSTNICLKLQFSMTGLMQDDTSRMSVRGQKLYHFFSCSTWSEYTVVNVNYVVQIDPAMDLHHASLVSCGFSTGYGAAWKVAHVKKDSTVAVFGLGSVGLGAVEGARANGASKIIGVDIQDTRKEIGEAYGVTDFINPSLTGDKPSWELILEMTGGLGVDFSFDCTGAPNVVAQAMACTKKNQIGLSMWNGGCTYDTGCCIRECLLAAVLQGRGITILIGANHEMNLNPTLPYLSFGRTLKGTLFGGIRPHSDLPAIFNKCLTGELKLDKLITHQLHLGDIGRAFELIKEPDCIKIILNISI